jgi:hypothetical protein
MATIDQFKANLIGGGPRANRFKVFIPRTGNKIEFLCKAASLPGSSFSETEVKYMGNSLKLPGDRAYEDWTVTIINDVNFEVRTGLEAHMNEIQGTGTGIGSTTLDYLVDRAFVEQLDKADNVLARYEFFNMYPKSIAAITLDYDTTDALETFDVIFSFSHWERVV